MEARGMGTHRLRGLPAIKPRLHPRASTPNLAMVGPLAATFSKHLCRNFGDLAGSPLVSGIGTRKRGDSGRNGGASQHRERVRQGILGMGVGFHYKKNDVSGDVPGS